MRPYYLNSVVRQDNDPIALDLTDPDHHMRCGKSYEASRNWAQAVDHYYRALSCLPSVLESTQYLQHYFLDKAPPANYSKKEFGEIYAAIGRCMFAMERFGDARLNFEASQYWEPNGQIAREHIEMLDLRPDHRTCHTISQTGNAKGDGEFLRDRITLLIITHETNKLHKYKELAPPSTRLLSATCGSLIDVFGTDIMTCPKVICYDGKKTESYQRPDSYLTALERFCQKFNFTLLRFHQAGLLAILNFVVPTITTPYIFVLEHDWLFEPQAVQLPDVIAAMDRHEDIHLIRFNKRRNKIAHFDFIMEEEKDVIEIPLLRTPAYSNNPSLVRTKALRDYWLPICSQDAYFMELVKKKGTARGVEQPMMKAQMRSIRQKGFQGAHKQWGRYILGNVGDQHSIIHLGE